MNGGKPEPARTPSDLERYQALLEVSESIALHHDLPALFHDLAERLHHLVSFDFLSLVLYDPARNVMRLHILESLVPISVKPCIESSLEDSPAGWVWETQKPLVVNDLEQETRFPQITAIMREHGVKSFCTLPLSTAQGRVGAMGLGCRRLCTYSEEDLEFLQHVAKQVAVAVDNALAYGQIAELKEKLAEEKLYLEDEIRTDHDFEEIVGESLALKRVLKEAETVAPTDSNVLIQGETGTGKEVIARTIHNLSARHERTFVKLNCAAIPSGLLESELFGHEKGAFTGAIAQKIGRFELAHQGTLFLDELGDIPLELQPKLLRVLQEQEFERLGGTRTTRVDVRLIAATNRDLGRMVADRQFRSDLYYRVNVFPILVPPLRERPEDIPLLVRYFAQRYARRMNKTIETIPTETMQVLTRWHWPGNIRELENIIERAVILSPGPVLRVPLAELQAATELPKTPIATLEAAERDHILLALEATKWIIGGPRGAANLLGMKRTTLQSKIRKLGISNPVRSKEHVANA